MKTLRITHTTEYRYSEAVTFGRHRLVIRPREGHDVRVESFQLAISPANTAIWSRDVFGNSVTFVEFLEPAAHLSVASEAIVTIQGDFPLGGGESPWQVPFPVVYDALESAVAAAYRATTYGEDAGLVHELLKDHALLTIPLGDGAEAVLDRINRFLYQHIKYNRRPEKGTQSPAQTLHRRSGSCRDIATLLMEAARSLGIAARFASGYLDCLASLAGRASTHAWIEAYLPPHGWIGFDPTLGERCSEKHIPCGLSNHPRGVMPISGTWTRTPTAIYQSMEVAVKITPVA